MENGRKKLDGTGLAGMVLGILSFICIIISSMTYIGIKICSLQIESVFIIIFLITALSLAIIGIILGYDGRKRWALGQSSDGNLTGTGAMISGFVTIGCAALLIFILQIQGASGLIFRDAPKQESAAAPEDQLKENTAKTAALVNMILPHAKSYAKNMEEDTAAPAIEKLSVKYGFDQKDTWGNDIIVKFTKRLDADGYFASWVVDVSSAGPDGKPGTGDDIVPDKK